jgi:mRNA interferase RelE/StbE
MRALGTDPRPPGAKPLKGHRPWLRVRVGDYRIIYDVDDAARVVTVAVVGHRREVYRGLDL